MLTALFAYIMADLYRENIFRNTAPFDYELTAVFFEKTEYLRILSSAAGWEQKRSNFV